jgi:hypothetical protein
MSRSRMAAKRRSPKQSTRRPASARVDVTRLEFTTLLDRVERNEGNIRRNAEDLVIQLKRFAQIQGEVDEIKRLLRK